VTAAVPSSTGPGLLVRRLRGKVAVVTGAASGLGEAIGTNVRGRGRKRCDTRRGSGEGRAYSRRIQGVGGDATPSRSMSETLTLSEY
jgi:NAD(P)-dependent dehydrogenase (short-subunit alcohol dehydrogenase family)